MKQILERLQDEHKEIHDSADALQEIFREDVNEQLAFLREIKNKVRTLSEQLEKHFYYEESIGKFDEVKENAPRYTTLIDKLLIEHKEIVDAAEKLSKKTVDLENSVTDGLRTVSREFVELHEKIDSHERKETELYQAAFYTDVSESD